MAHPRQIDRDRRCDGLAANFPGTASGDSAHSPDPHRPSEARHDLLGRLSGLLTFRGDRLCAVLDEYHGRPIEWGAKSSVLYGLVWKTMRKLIKKFTMNAIAIPMSLAASGGSPTVNTPINVTPIFTVRPMSAAAINSVKPRTVASRLNTNRLVKL